MKFHGHESLTFGLITATAFRFILSWTKQLQSPEIFALINICTESLNWL